MGRAKSNSEVGILRSLYGISREAVQPFGKVQNRNRDGEEILYIIEGTGSLVDGDGDQKISEGDMIHIPPGYKCDIENSDEIWLVYLVISGEERS